MDCENEIEKICRLCLSKNAKKLLLDRKYSDLLHLAKLMTGLELENEKKFKPKICTNCIKRLQLIEEFHKQCLISNKYFSKVQAKLVKLNSEFKVNQKQTVSTEPETIELQIKPDNLKYENIDWVPSTEYLFPIKEEVIENNTEMFEDKCKMEVDDKKLDAPETYKQTSKNKSDARKRRIGVFICEICGNIYNTNEYLNIHKNAKHNPNFKKLKCDICGKEFDFKQSLKVHKAYHNEPSCECTICKKKLHTKKELKTHMLIHNNIRNFKCEICSKAFRTSYNRRVHMRAVHSKLRPFQCDIGDCIKAFSENFLLNLHKKKYHKNKI